MLFFVKGAGKTLIIFIQNTGLLHGKKYNMAIAPSGACDQLGHSSSIAARSVFFLPHGFLRFSITVSAHGHYSVKKTLGISKMIGATA